MDSRSDKCLSPGRGPSGGQLSDPHVLELDDDDDDDDDESVGILHSSPSTMLWKLANASMGFPEACMHARDCVR